MNQNNQREAYIAWLRDQRGLSEDDAAARADAPKPRPFEPPDRDIPERWDNVVPFRPAIRAIAIVLVAALCAGCQPYTFGTVWQGPRGETVLSGADAAAYRVTRAACLREGLAAMDRRATWAACMRSAGYTVTVGTD